MSENLKKLLAEAEKNEELKARLAALTDKDTAVEKAIEIAKEYGITLTAEDFQSKEDAELSLDELDAISGGGWCVAVGAGDIRGCFCFLIGVADVCGCIAIGTA